MIYVAWGLLGFAVYIAVLNASAIFYSHKNIRNGIDKHYSTSPLITIVVGAMVYVIFEAKGAERYSILAWIPAIMDVGNWNFFLGVLYLIVQKIKGNV